MTCKNYLNLIYKLPHLYILPILKNVFDIQPSFNDKVDMALNSNLTIELSES